MPPNRSIKILGSTSFTSTQQPADLFTIDRPLIHEGTFAAGFRRTSALKARKVRRPDSSRFSLMDHSGFHPAATLPSAILDNVAKLQFDSLEKTPRIRRPSFE